MEKLREPLRTLIGKYEAQLGCGFETGRSFGQSLWNFFRHFPKKSRPDQFSLADVQDYRVWRATEGIAYSTIRKELGTFMRSLNFFKRRFLVMKV